ncbi:MAG: hypothetical protein LQ350_007771 [Teloschistes chrysophthalmus]|nr:MAG: hypothetical protein LQ350_007771 [Niorma chrysophthalma]
MTPTSFIKRQLRGDEVRYRKDGSIAEHPFNHERIENERDALTFIAKHTTIPVPRVLEWTDIDGVGCLTVERLKGRPWLDTYYDLNPEDQEKMKDKLSAFLNQVMTPQLNQLRSKTIGQLSGAVFPPPRVSFYYVRSWESRTSSTDGYVYCHNDLALHNLFVDPETFDIEAVIDWEYSGFFPPELEYPFYELGKEASLDEDHCRKMIALLEAPVMDTTVLIRRSAMHIGHPHLHPDSRSLLQDGMA